MLRTTTSQIYQKRKTNQTILRSRRKIPQYSDTLNNSLNGYPDEYNNNNNNNNSNRYGDFNVLNENNHPGVIYYFIEVVNPVVPNNRNGPGSDNNNNNSHIG